MGSLSTARAGLVARYMVNLTTHVHSILHIVLSDLYKHFFCRMQRIHRSSRWKNNELSTVSLFLSHPSIRKKNILFYASVCTVRKSHLLVQPGKAHLLRKLFNSPTVISYDPVNKANDFY